MALSDESVRIDDPRLMAEDRLALILGTEGDGLAEETISDCDYTVRIPMAHGVDSLNGGGRQRRRLLAARQPSYLAAIIRFISGTAASSGNRAVEITSPLAPWIRFAGTLAKAAAVP